ncbi:MAG: hypothetical protein JWM89_1980 [Acidimicrobiales bacterium]|nr:hypothetical protein [Acidimicrobiales bacterium]
MSDASQGPGWWQASDGKWYPPEQAPGAAPASAPTGPPPSGPPVGGPPVGPPAGYATAPPYGAPAAPPMGGNAELADWGVRVVSTLIDTALIFVGFLVVLVVGAILGAVSNALGAIVFILGYLACIGGSWYFSYLTGLTGQSPGKKLQGIKVVSEATGQPIGGGGGIIRIFAHIPDGLCFIGYLFPLWDAKKQTFADKIQSTVVISGLPKQSFSADLFKA